MSLRTLVILGLALLVLYGLFTVGLPFLLALMTAIFLEPIHQLLIRRLRFGRLGAATLVCTLFTLVGLLLAYLLGTKIVTEVVQFWKDVPSYINEAKAYIDNASTQTELFYNSLPPETADLIRSGIDNGLTKLTDSLTGLIKDVSSYFLGVAKSIPNFLIFLVVYVIALYLYAYSLPLLRSSFVALFEAGSRDKVSDVLDNLRLAIFGFIRAQLILSILTYLVCFVGLIFLHVQYPLAIALLVSVGEFIPIVGTGLIFLPWAGYQFLNGNSGLAIAILVLFLVIVLFRRIVEPKILSDSVGISSLAALVSVYVGFELVGIVGIFLGPVLVIIYQAMRRAGLLTIQIRLE
ncbi:sporulation protein [Gordoniibacillus kamchatkensis]|uniref:Sporulation protein n=1 Tax=Gordoniibacillus kamchatkensis TaxID=1590651 RepID=A0ABR5APV4_9BACL|nr:sporulation integral membrane protein YtvI [Paenibacillus sp. VKM B-2647]KIL42402.1 sporulation protein [Paenibacillus sp. VKM B-2647]